MSLTSIPLCPRNLLIPVPFAVAAQVPPGPIHRELGPASTGIQCHARVCPGHAAGGTLLHADIRTDNLLLADHGPVVVDWPWACRGAAFVDLVLFAPSVAMQGSPPPADLIALSRYGRAASREALAALACGLAGYFTERALRPPPPGLPTVRAFQAAQGTVARRWLAELI